MTSQRRNVKTQQGRYDGETEPKRAKYQSQMSEGLSQMSLGTCSQSSSRAEFSQRSQILTSSTDPFRKDTDTVVGIEDRISDAICLILAHNSAKRSIKRAEILHDFKNVRGKDADSIMNHIKQVLKLIFGLDFVEIEHHVYLLVNPEIPGEASPESSFLLLLLSAMIHSDLSVSEDQLNGFLTRIGVELKGKDNYFGDINKMIQELIKQRYISKSVCDTTKKVFYHWGKRAELEIKKEVILEFLSEVYQRSVNSLPFNLKKHSSEKKEE